MKGVSDQNVERKIWIQGRGSNCGRLTTSNTEVLHVSEDRIKGQASLAPAQGANP